MNSALSCCHHCHAWLCCFSTQHAFARHHGMNYTGREGVRVRPRPTRSVRLLLSLLACCCRCLRGECQASFSSSSAPVVEGTSTRQHQQHQRSRSSASTVGFIAGGLPVRERRTSWLSRSGGYYDSRSRSSSGSSRSSAKRMMMNTTRAKRGAVGKGKKQNGVGKKVRRILEPASREEVWVLCVQVRVCIEYLA